MSEVLIGKGQLETNGGGVGGGSGAPTGSAATSSNIPCTHCFHVSNLQDRMATVDG